MTEREREDRVGQEDSLTKKVTVPCNLQCQHAEIPLSSVATLHLKPRSGQISFIFNTPCS